MIRKLMSTVVIIGTVVFGLAAQAGAYLLAFNSPPVGRDSPALETLRFAARGPHAVGIRQLPDEDGLPPVTLWYPAVSDDADSPPVTYAFSMNMLGAETSTALATHQGRARRGAPADTATGPFPLVILSHGFAITASSYGWLAEHLASYGLVVAAPNHGELLSPGLLWESTIQRPKDIVALMKALREQARPGGELAELVDVDLVAVVGHSYGGYAAQAVGGARLDTGSFEAACEATRGSDDPIQFLCSALIPHLSDMAEAADLPSIPLGMWPDWSDPSVDAVVSIAGDAAMFGPDGLAELRVPVMAIGGTADTDSPYSWGTRFTYDHSGSDRRIEIGLVGAGHMVFAGGCECTRRIVDLVPLGFCADPGWERDEAHRVVSHYVTAFLMAELENDQNALPGLARDNPGLQNVAYHAQGYSEQYQKQY